ncbi:hypothetical protein [Chondromyces crocatus]|nr:hypothetical protein [Chondromyces crocatus]
MLVFQTDMSLPKDIDAIRLLVTVEGAVVFDETYRRLGEEDSIKLPATLGFLTPDDPSLPLRLRVIGSRGSDEGVQVLREVVTTVPDGRTAMLQVPIQFLCYGSAEVERDEQGNVKRDADGQVVVKSSCAEGQTCIAGSCVVADLPSDDLPDFVRAEVFGGGSGAGDGLCFDTLSCFGQGAATQPKFMALADGQRACVADVPPGGAALNVALRTQGGGICGELGCFVPLDAGVDAGWKSIEGDRLRLPDAVCDRAEAGTLLGLTIAAAGVDTCRQKGTDLPTCGPWSSSGVQYTQADVARPLPIALGLTHPVALTVAPSGIYWIESGKFDASGASAGEGAVKSVPLGGGEPKSLATNLVAPRDLAVDEASDLVFFTTAGASVEEGALLAVSPSLGVVTTLLGERRLPDGIARRAGSLLWAEMWGDELMTIATTGEGTSLTVQGQPSSVSPGATLGKSPHRVEATVDVACWTYQGTLAVGDGAVACQRGTAPPEVIAQQQLTPRALAFDVDADGRATAVYWASFDGGTISRVAIDSSAFGAPEVLFQDQPLPSGVAVDDAHVYWSNRGDGTILRAPKAGGAAEVIASGQRRPGAIAVDGEAIYWLNGGSPDAEPGVPARDGALMKLLK